MTAAGLWSHRSPRGRRSTPACRAGPTGIRPPTAREPGSSTSRPGKTTRRSLSAKESSTGPDNATWAAVRRRRFRDRPTRACAALRINTYTEAAGHGSVMALDIRTGQKKWKFDMTDVTDAGILTTASDLLFTGGREGYFHALDARTGALLWKASVGGPVAAAPITYRIDGKQYVAIAAGHALFVYGLRE